MQPKRAPRVPATFLLSPEARDLVVAQANVEERTFSEMVRLLVKRGLEHQASKAARQ